MADLSARGKKSDASPGGAGQKHDGEGGSPVPSFAQDAPSPPPERDLAGALHEVSNALTVVLGWIEQARTSEGQDVRGALEIASVRARQARHIIRRAIGADVADDALCSAADLIHDAVKGLEPEAKGLGVRLEASIDPEVAGASIEQRSTALQILTNLILNALAVSPPGALVSVDARAGVSVDAGGTITIGVSDEGPGISPPRRATLFDAGVTTRAGGAGIGLRHAAALARAAGGELSLADAESGARFELRWPRASASLDRRRASSSAPHAGLAGARILLVEDDDAVIDLLDTALTARGATVVSAKTPSALREALIEGRFDAALLDISPIRDDLEGVFGAVRGSSPSAKLIVISGSAGSEPALPDQFEALWVRKPFEIREIVEALAR